MTRRQRRMKTPYPRDTTSTTTSNTAGADSTSSDIPMSRPPAAAAAGVTTSESIKPKTLLEIAAERQAQLSPYGELSPKASTHSDDDASVSNGTKFVTLTTDGKISESLSPARQAEGSGLISNGSREDSSQTLLLPPLLDTLFLSAPLASLHFTLSFLTYHQYAQRETLSILSLLRQTILVALPTLTILIHAAHGHLNPPSVRSQVSPGLHAAGKIVQQICFVITANVAGCYLIFLTNEKGYFAVMKRAPAIGTLWVWCVIELGLLGALLGVIGPGLFAWWSGYSVI